MRAVLRRLADDASVAGESTFTYGRLHAAEERRGRELQRRVPARRGGRLGPSPRLAPLTCPCDAPSGKGQDDMILARVAA